MTCRRHVPAEEAPHDGRPAYLSCLLGGAGRQDGVAEEADTIDVHLQMLRKAEQGAKHGFNYSRLQINRHVSVQRAV
jgi:hypothetical protein